MEMLELEDPESSTGKVYGKVKISIINSEKVYRIPFLAKYKDKENFSLTGKVNLVFSDFDLVPPKRFGGMIKIDKTIAVNFRLQLQNK